MIKPEDVPDAVAAMLDPSPGYGFTDAIKKSIAAALNAWPGADYVVEPPPMMVDRPMPACLILPLGDSK